MERLNFNRLKKSNPLKTADLVNARKGIECGQPNSKVKKHRAASGRPGPRLGHEYTFFLGAQRR